MMAEATCPSQILPGTVTGIGECDVLGSSMHMNEIVSSCLVKFPHDMLGRFHHMTQRRGSVGVVKFAYM